MGESNSKTRDEQNTPRIKDNPPNGIVPPVDLQQKKPAYSIDDYADCVKSFGGGDKVRSLIIYLQRQFVFYFS